MRNIRWPWLLTLGYVIYSLGARGQDVSGAVNARAKANGYSTSSVSIDTDDGLDWTAQLGRPREQLDGL